MILMLLAAQATGTAPPAPAPEAVVPIDFDIRTVKPSPEEIVVTARRQDQRLPPLTAFVEEPEGLPRAETGLFGQVRGAITAEQVQLPGATSQRAMVKLKVPF